MCQDIVTRVTLCGERGVKYLFLERFQPDRFAVLQDIVGTQKMLDVIIPLVFEKEGSLFRTGLAPVLH